jgi:RND superfamily putative drug exporter
MFIVPVSIFRTMAIGAILVVIAAMLASLTLLPAVLSLLGDRVNRLRVPYFGNGTHLHEDRGFWATGAHLVMRYKYVSAVAGAALLVFLASSYTRIDLGQAGVATLPEGNQARQAFEVLDANFQAGLSTPAEIVIDGDIASPGVQTAIDTLVARIEADTEHGYGAVGPLQVAPSGGLALIQVPLSGDVASDEAIEAIRTLRDDYVPAAFGSTDATALVGGLTASTFDFFELVKDWTPIVLAFVLGLSFVLLLLVFRSLFVPLKAIVMNLLSVGAAYGLLVLIFQEGHGAGLLGFQTVEEIEAWVPLFLFTILFGLSMDYEVFLLSRIRERYDQTRNNSEAISFGLRSTANIITGAAAIMIIVFSGFALGELVMFQQLGFGLAVAIFFDATIVRMVLVPATMAMVGDWNWYLPSWLNWLPDMRVEGPRAPHEATPAAASPAAAAGD